MKQPDGSVKALSVKQVAELLGHTTSEITEIYYVKRDNSRLAGLTVSISNRAHPLKSQRGDAKFATLSQRKDKRKTVSDLP